jgi:hypothetical protein
VRPIFGFGSAPLRGYRTVPLGLMVAVSAAGPQKRDFSHAGTASTAVRMLRTRRDRMKPGFHLALTRWKSRFTGFTAGQTRVRAGLA